MNAESSFPTSCTEVETMSSEFSVWSVIKVLQQAPRFFFFFFRKGYLKKNSTKQFIFSDSLNHLPFFLIKDLVVNVKDVGEYNNNFVLKCFSLKNILK
jgi:hypothetical protein